MEGETVSVGDEIISFLNVYFGNGLDGGITNKGTLAVAVAHNSSGNINGNNSIGDGIGTDPQLGRDGSRIVWVENARSGELVPVRV